MLADRAGVTLGDPARARRPVGLSKVELLAVNGLGRGRSSSKLCPTSSEGALILSSEREGSRATRVARFRLGYAPEIPRLADSRRRRRRDLAASLERVGLIVRPSGIRSLHERFRGRLIFPIHDPRWGGRSASAAESCRRSNASKAESGKNVAKYLNSSRDAALSKRRILYGATSPGRRPLGRRDWVAVVEGYTDVIAAHQVGLSNVGRHPGHRPGGRPRHQPSGGSDRPCRPRLRRRRGRPEGRRPLARTCSYGHEVDVRVLTLPEDRSTPATSS